MIPGEFKIELWYIPTEYIRVEHKLFKRVALKPSCAKHRVERPVDLPEDRFDDCLARCVDCPPGFGLRLALHSLDALPLSFGRFRANTCPVKPPRMATARTLLHQTAGLNVAIHGLSGYFRAVRRTYSGR